MSMGERIRGARVRANLSLRDLAKMADISAMAISKYENGLDIPSSGVLIRMAKALHQRVEYFLRPTRVSLSQPSYRSQRSKLRVRDESLIQAQVLEWLERYLVIEDLVEEHSEFVMPKIERKIQSMEDVERLAIDLREIWQLGLDPIEHLIEILEAQGIKVGVVAGTDSFDALTLMANGTIPVIVVKSGIFGDRQRLSIAHELGHLILKVPAGLDEEKAAFRFAGAFLAPQPSVLKELGSTRQRLDVNELLLLKHKYGISMQAWLFRARDLGIISAASFVAMWQQFNARGWKVKEPGDAYPSETTDRLERMVLRAIAEDIISTTRAEELLGSSLADYWETASIQHDKNWLPTDR